MRASLTHMLEALGLVAVLMAPISLATGIDDTGTYLFRSHLRDEVSEPVPPPYLSAEVNSSPEL